MRQRRNVIAVITTTLTLLSHVAVGFAQQTIEGTVVSTTLTACEFKPGTCEGTLVLETKAAGKPSQVTIKVPKGTQIKQGNEHLFLPGTKGRLVAITHAEDKGEKVAKSIEVKTPRP